MADAKIGEFKCETKKIHKSWEVEKWNDGEACVEICENLAKQHGPGCCEARHRADFTKAFCIFGEGRIEGLPDSKAVLCTKLPAGTKY